jgi:hypothetical protein
MKEANKNLLYIASILAITILTIIILISIPNYLRQPNENHIPITSYFFFIFILIDIILIGILAGLHWLYVKDYTPIKSIWFFIIFGTIFGVLLGEAANPVMLIPYAAFMLVFAFLYKKFPWWKVAITTYLAGTLIENAMNRSPIQAPTLLWIAFFTYPYFAAKIWENRKKLHLIEIIKDLKYVFLWTAILLALTKFIVKSIPAAFIPLTIAIAFFAVLIKRIIKKK